MSEEDAEVTPVPGKGHRSRSHEPLLPTGSFSTRDLQELARRRREAEEKLQQHLQEAKEKTAEA